MNKKIPNFKNEEEEREFWSKHNFSDYLNWNQCRTGVIPNLKPSTRAISLRLTRIPSGCLAPAGK